MNGQHRVLHAIIYTERVLPFLWRAGEMELTRSSGVPLKRGPVLAYEVTTDRAARKALRRVIRAREIAEKDLLDRAASEWLGG